MLPMTQLELHVAHGCNLSCESCSHYSNQGHKGMVDLETAEEWLSLWSGRVSPEHFNLLGGEPALHPDLPEFVRLARRHWPESTLRVITNGFLLHRHPRLPAALRETDTILAVSVHHSSAEYTSKFRPVEDLVRTWERDHGVRVQLWDVKGRWTRRYKGFGSSMQPYEDGQPRQSWSICPARFSVQVYLGKLWKCPALAYLGIQHERHGLSEKWAPYLRYAPLEPECSVEELRHFLAKEEESCCSMCPAVAQPFELPNPLIPVGIRRQAA